MNNIADDLNKAYSDGFADGYKQGQKEIERKGHWIHQTKFGRIECDQCGKVYRNAFAPKNYCPNCGFRMMDEVEHD